MAYFENIASVLFWKYKGCILNQAIEWYRSVVCLMEVHNKGCRCMYDVSRFLHKFCKIHYWVYGIHFFNSLFLFFHSYISRLSAELIYKIVAYALPGQNSLVYSILDRPALPPLHPHSREASFNIFMRKRPMQVHPMDLHCPRSKFSHTTSAPSLPSHAFTGDWDMICGVQRVGFWKRSGWIWRSRSDISQQSTLPWRKSRQVGVYNQLPRPKANPRIWHDQTILHRWKTFFYRSIK